MSTAKKHFDYRYIICIIITLGFLACGVFLFPNSLGRIIESGRDFGLSVAYYFCEMFGIDYSFTPTVNEFAQIPFFPSWGGQAPIPFLPENWDGFKNAFVEYWQIWATVENLTDYLMFLGKLLFVLCKVLVIMLPILLILYLAFKRYLKKQNNNYDKDSRPLRGFKRLAFHTYRPAKLWLIGLYSFIRERKGYWVTWLCLWLFYFNAFAIIVEFLAFYFYFVMSFDVQNIYRQVYKLFVDLSVPFSFIPLWAWVIIAIIVLELISRKIAYNRLYHRERCNRGFINERGVVTCVIGTMGKGKTMQISDMALSTDVQFRDDAFEIILEIDMKFPYFPWVNFENALKQVIENHEVYDLWTCRGWVKTCRVFFNNDKRSEYIFGYDFERYGLEYDDKLKLTNIWEALEDYACAYFIYTRQTALLISNYAIRTDMLFADLGNFPLWDGDFFKRDSRLMDSYSRHSHILDFDMLRLGKKMLEDSSTAYAFGFGVYVVSEIDKERKNTPELKEVKASATECNQKNDLFNVLLKMSRHACVVANRVFIKIFADLQRADSLGADARELGEIVEIKSKGEKTVALPFFAPFNLFNLIFGWLSSKFLNFYVQYRYTRADNTLFMHIFKTITAKLQHYCTGVTNMFGSQSLTLEVESGAREGEVKQCKYYRQSKKIYSKRYSTDCLSGIFEARAARNEVSIDDLAEYADIMATNSELKLQNSHFQTEINALNSAS